MVEATAALAERVHVLGWMLVWHVFGAGADVVRRPRCGHVAIRGRTSETLGGRVGVRDALAEEVLGARIAVGGQVVDGARFLAHVHHVHDVEVMAGDGKGVAVARVERDDGLVAVVGPYLKVVVVARRGEHLDGRHEPGVVRDRRGRRILFAEQHLAGRRVVDERNGVRLLAVHVDDDHRVARQPFHAPHVVLTSRHTTTHDI